MGVFGDSNMIVEHHVVTVQGAESNTFGVYATRRGAEAVARAFVEARLFGAGFEPEDRVEVYIDEDRVYVGRAGRFVGPEALRRVSKGFQDIISWRG